MLTDYSEKLERLEKALGEHYRESPYILGVPGTSLACKVDPFYYLAIQPGFVKYLSRWTAMLPETVTATLVKTGNMLSGMNHTAHSVPLRVFEEGLGHPLTVNASFLPAEFIDRAVTLHGGASAPLPVSRLKILDEDGPAAAFLFESKTPLAALAFGKP